MFIKKYGDLLVGAVFLVIAIVFYAMASALPASMITEGVGSDFLPKILAIGTGILAVLQCIKGVRTMRSDITVEEEEFKPEYWRVLSTIVAFGIYVFVLNTVGFLISSIVYLFVQMLILAPKEKRNIPLLLVITVVFNVAVYFLFRNGLNVMLPAGFLG